MYIGAVEYIVHACIIVAKLLNIMYILYYVVPFLQALHSGRVKHSLLKYISSLPEFVGKVYFFNNDSTHGLYLKEIKRENLKAIAHHLVENVEFSKWTAVGHL